MSRLPSRGRVEQEREETEGLSRELMGGARRGSRGQCLCRAHGRVCIFRMCKYCVYAYHRGRAIVCVCVWVCMCEVSVERVVLTRLATRFTLGPGGAAGALNIYSHSPRALHVWHLPESTWILKILGFWILDSGSRYTDPSNRCENPELRIQIPLQESTLVFSRHAGSRLGSGFWDLGSGF